MKWVRGIEKGMVLPPFHADEGLPYHCFLWHCYNKIDLEIW